MTQREVTVVRHGTWLYDGQVERPVRILRQNWDYYYEEAYDLDPPDLNDEGHAYYVVYGAPQPPAPDDPRRHAKWVSRSRTCLTLEEAIELAERAVGSGIDWGRLPEIEDLEGHIHELQKTAGRFPLSADQMLEAWDSCVKLCEEGFPQGMDEFAADLAVRDRVALVLEDPALRRLRALDWFRARCAAIDSRFKALLQEGVRIGSEKAPWWRCGVLSYAGKDYVEDIERTHGIEVAQWDP